ncbi:MAG TPA: peptide chain release factor N(5)-glutamine methyltransferase [Solirubrobacterales bacterium]|nr:peptide chain release factor N(5)-glutamine methyltransferase [Solirubrobacterales bacterium]
MAAAATAGSVREALGGAADALAAMGVETPRLDAELLLAEATGWSRARMATEPELGVPAPAARRFGEMVRRRLRREPVAYILGRKGFRSIELTVDRRVLIPRPETELLVELALELGPRRVLDIGTGSGAIALAIAGELPSCEVIATDASRAALEVASANAARLGLAERVKLVEATLPPGLDELDLIVANLPYVAESEWGDLEPEVTKWEPRQALLAGADGLDAIRGLLADRGRLLLPKAQQKTTAGLVLALEVGEGQAGAVAELMRGAGFGAIETRADLAGILRVVIGRRDRSP